VTRQCRIRPGLKPEMSFRPPPALGPEGVPSPRFRRPDRDNFCASISTLARLAPGGSTIATTFEA
jgi:hypothetical protein